MKRRKNIEKSFLAGLVATIMITSVLTVLPSVKAISVGTSENGILAEEWRYDMHWYQWGYFGSSPGIADLGPDVNTEGTEPDADLEIVTGSDECGISIPGSGYFDGIWRCFDSQGNIEWVTDTQSDESRGDVAIVDINNDGYLEVAGGTTSGETVEVMDRFGNFFWTFPDPPHSGSFMWPGGPAVADVDTAIDGLELIVGNRPLHEVYCLQGDNSDGINQGYSWAGGLPWTGTEGVDWDILWLYTVPTNCEIYSTVALGDVDNDGTMEAIFGATNGNIYVLNAITGSLEWSYSTGGQVYASAALADLDGDGYLEIVMGSTNGNVYLLQWDGSTGNADWIFSTGGAVYSSAAIGDIDGDGDLEIVIGSNDGKIYALSASGSEEWSYATGGRVYSSPSLADRLAGKYAIEWAMFRNNPERTGYYGLAPSRGLDVYVGSGDRYLYLLDGSDGSLIDRFLTEIGNQGIHTSPSVADVDGDYKLEIFFYDWGQGSIYNGHTFWALENMESGYLPVYVDVKPGSCPNPINRKDNGVLPVAVCGTDEFDVTTIDPATIKLTRNGIEEKIEPIRWSYEDVATPYTGDEGCGCHTLTGDGYMDLSLKFKTQDVVDGLALVLVGGETIPLIITGNLKEEYDGTPIKGEDCVWVLYSKDVGITDILSPFSGGVQTFTPEVIVKNFGTKKEKNVPVNLVIKTAGVTEYNKTAYVNIDVGEILHVTFPDWTPQAWYNQENIDIDYMVTACTKMTGDEKPSNNCLSEVTTLHYPYLHDVGVTEIISPTGGPSQAFIPKISVKNFGQYDETNIPVNMVISKIAYGAQWLVYNVNGDSVTWTQYSAGHAGTYCASISYHYPTDDDWLVTNPVVVPSGGGMFSFWWKTGNTYYVEHFKVYYSTSGNTIADFTGPNGHLIGDITYNADTNWHQFTYYLSSPEQVWFAVYCDSADALRFSVDDFAFPDGTIQGFNEGIFPPHQVILIPEYDETTTVNLTTGEALDVVFPSWMPLDIGEYLVAASTQLATDGNQANDFKTEILILD
jgi:hypothetical protein